MGPRPVSWFGSYVLVYPEVKSFVRRGLERRELDVE
jgi:hypothetical protein